MAHRRPAAMSAQRSLTGAKQTSGQLVKNVENDPEQTSNVATSSSNSNRTLPGQCIG